MGKHGHSEKAVQHRGRGRSDVSTCPGDAMAGWSAPDARRRQRRSPHDWIQREHGRADTVDLDFQALEL